jgi:hypothetical protein
MNAESPFVKSRFVKRAAAALATTTLVCLSSGARADATADAPKNQPPPAAAATPATAPAVKPDADAANMKEAKDRFERALALYDDGDYDAALVEFHRAYDLAPTYKILYNIAKIQRHTNNYSAAITNFERYLQLGGAEVPADRRDEVEKELAVLKTRVAVLDVKTNVEGADVYIDDSPICSERTLASTCIGKTPLQEPVIVNPGRRRISISKRGYLTASSTVTVAGGDATTVHLELVDLAPRAVDNGPRNRAIASWSITGALAASAGVLGILTLTKRSDYNHDLGLPPCANQTINSNSCLTNTASKLSSDESTVKTFAMVTDILTGAAVVAGGISIYFTVKAVNHDHGQEKDPTPAAAMRLDFGPGSAALLGSF